MFDTLDEVRKHDQATVPPRKRWLRQGLVLLIATVLFSGLYASIQFFE
jgi:hypothetical protein